MAAATNQDWHPSDEIEDCLDDDDSYIDDECCLMPDGQCMLAGTEFCDWDCGRLG